MAKKGLIIASILVAVLGGGFLAHYYSDKAVIQRQLMGLTAELGKTGQEQPVQLALKMRNVKDALPKSCQITVPEKGYQVALEPDVIIQYLIYHRNRFSQYLITVERLVVHIPAKGQATAQGTLRIRSQRSPQNEAQEQSYAVELALAKSEKKWLVHAVTMPGALVDQGILEN